MRSSVHIVKTYYPLGVRTSLSQNPNARTFSFRPRIDYNHRSAFIYEQTIIYRRFCCSSKSLLWDSPWRHLAVDVGRCYPWLAGGRPDRSGRNVIQNVSGGAVVYVLRQPRLQHVCCHRSRPVYRVEARQRQRSRMKGKGRDRLLWSAINITW